MISKGWELFASSTNKVGLKLASLFKSKMDRIFCPSRACEQILE